MRRNRAKKKRGRDAAIEHERRPRRIRARGPDVLRVSVRETSSSGRSIAREAKNALSAELLQALGEAIDDAADGQDHPRGDPHGLGRRLRVGRRSARAARPQERRADAAMLTDVGEHVCRRIGELHFPGHRRRCTGVAIGGGAELALACDFRIAEDRARICFKQVRMGATTAWGSLATARSRSSALRRRRAALHGAGDQRRRRARVRPRRLRRRDRARRRDGASPGAPTSPRARPSRSPR